VKKKEPNCRRNTEKVEKVIGKPLPNATEEELDKWAKQMYDRIMETSKDGKE
jgi:hypothetical protein